MDGLSAREFANRYYGVPSVLFVPPVVEMTVPRSHGEFVKKYQDAWIAGDRLGRTSQVKLGAIDASTSVRLLEDLYRAVKQGDAILETVESRVDPVFSRDLGFAATRVTAPAVSISVVWKNGYIPDG